MLEGKDAGYLVGLHLDLLALVARLVQQVLIVLHEGLRHGLGPDPDGSERALVIVIDDQGGLRRLFRLLARHESVTHMHSDSEPFLVTCLHDVLRKSRLVSDAMLAPTSEVQVQRNMLFDACLRRHVRSPGHSRRPHLALRLGRP